MTALRVERNRGATPFPRQPHRAASIVAMSIFPIGIIARCGTLAVRNLYEVIVSFVPEIRQLIGLFEFLSQRRADFEACTTPRASE